MRAQPHTGLVVKGLSKAYGPQRVLDTVDLAVPAGTVTVVSGDNGSGKSTLLRCVAGLASHHGDVRFRGASTTQARRAMGYLPQTVGLTPWATPAEILAFIARLRSTHPYDHPLPSGFVPDADRPIATLSGGQRQRVAIATALLGSPSLLLLDEPAANLDDASAATLWKVVEQQADAGVTVVVAAPRSVDIGGIPARLVRLVDGRVAPVADVATDIAPDTRRPAMCAIGAAR